jgi:hypothetical protein
MLQEEAMKEHRSLANFIKHAIFTYIQEHKGIEIKDVDGASDSGALKRESSGARKKEVLF